MDASLVLEKLFSRTSFHDIAYFSVLASRPHLDAINTSEYILRWSSIGVVVFNREPFIWMFHLF